MWKRESESWIYPNLDITIQQRYHILDIAILKLKQKLPHLGQWLYNHNELPTKHRDVLKVMFGFMMAKNYFKWIERIKFISVKSYLKIKWFMYKSIKKKW
jgi:hypothetical protein